MMGRVRGKGEKEEGGKRWNRNRTVREGKEEDGEKHREGWEKKKRKERRGKRTWKGKESRREWRKGEREGSNARSVDEIN